MIVADMPSPLVPGRAPGLGRRPLTALPGTFPRGFLLGISVGTPEEPSGAAFPRGLLERRSLLCDAHEADAGPRWGPEGFAALARRAPEGVPGHWFAALRGQSTGVIRAGAAGICRIGAVLSAPDPEAVRGRWPLRARLMAAR